MNDWKFKFELPKINTRFDDEDELKIIQDLSSKHSKFITRMIIDTKDQQVREKLIELGWTPPDDKYMSEL